MRGPPWEGLLKNHEPRLKPPYSTSCFGEKIGTLNSGEDCWELTGDLRDQYYTAIHPKLCERLFAIFGTASISDWITLPVYMIGEHCTYALPTVMICSEDENARKKAKKDIKKSGFLKRHARFKVMSVSEDPGMRNMEQLASDANEGKATPAAKRAAKVLIDSSKPIQPLGMEVWVDHGLSLRPTTAFVSQIHGRTFLRTVDHAFVMTASPAKTTTTTRNLAIHVDSDSDSDSESEDEDELDVAITSIGSQSPDTWSDTGSESGSSSASTVFSERYTPRIGDFEYINSKAVSSDLEEVSSRLVPLVSLPTTYPPKQIVQPLKNTLVSLGRLAIWSVDKDWALIEITNEELMLAFKRSIAEDAPPAKPLPGPKDDAEVVAYTSSGGMLTGTFSGTPFCTRLPNSTSFQDVHRVRLNGALANGDCGSAVRNAATGELYGHIVAGCRTTGTAYIMAAHQIEADFAALITEGLSGPNHTLNDVQALTAQTAGTKEGNPQAVADRCQPIYTESRLQKFVGDLETSVPLPDEAETMRNHRKAISTLLLAPEAQVPLPPEWEALEIPDCQQHRRSSGSTTLYWSQELFSLLLPLLVLGFKVFVSGAEPKSLNSTLIYYGLLLAPKISRLLFLRVGRMLNAVFAIMKLGFLTAICVIGYLTQAGPEPRASSFTLKATIWILPFIALLAQLPYDSAFLVRHVVTNLPPLHTWRLVQLVHIIGSPVEAIFYSLARLTDSRAIIRTSSALEEEDGYPPTWFIAMYGLLGVILFWGSGRIVSTVDHLWQYLDSLGPHIVATAGTFLPFTVLHYMSKRRKRYRPKRVIMELERLIAIVAATGLTVLGIHSMGTLWSTLFFWAAMTSQLCRDLYSQGDIARLLATSALVMPVISALGLIYSGYARTTHSFIVYVVIWACLCVMLEVSVWGSSISKNEWYLFGWCYAGTLAILTMGLISESLDEMTSHRPCFTYYEFRRNRKEILRNEGKRPTWWKDVLQDLHVDERSHVWDVGLSLTCFLTRVTVVLFSIAGADLVRISTAESPRGLDSANSYASDTVVQLMAGLAVTSIMTSTALAWVAIGTWPKPRIRRAMEAAIVRWLCTVHGPTLGSWLLMLGAASFLYTHAKLESITNTVIIPMSLFWAILWFDAAQGRMNRFLERCRDHLRSALFISLFSNILVLVIWARHGNSGPTLLFGRVFTSHLHDNLVWRLDLLSLLVPIVPAVCLVYLMPESPRLMVKHGKYEQAFHALSVLRRTDIVACRDLIQLHFKVELEKELERVEHEPLLRISRERLRILAWVEGAENWQFVIALILCVFQLLSLAINSPNELPNGRISTSIERPLWIELIKAPSAPVIFIALFWSWMNHCQSYATLKDFDNIRMLQAYNTPPSDSVSKEEARPKPFVQSMPQTKAHLGFILCVSIVIAMGINSFLLKEVENWKRMSFGVFVGDIVVTSLCIHISQTLFRVNSRANDTYKNCYQEVSTLEKGIGELQQLVEGSEQGQLDLTIDEAETFLSDERRRKIHHVYQRDRLNKLKRKLSQVGRRIPERDPDTPPRGFEDGEEKKLDLECGHQQEPTFAHPTKRKALLCLALIFVMGINAFLLKEVENWKREAMAMPSETYPPIFYKPRDAIGNTFHYVQLGGVNDAIDIFLGNTTALKPKGQHSDWPDSSKRRGRRTGGLTTEQRRNAAATRSMGACMPCIVQRSEDYTTMPLNRLGHHSKACEKSPESDKSFTDPEKLKEWMNEDIRWVLERLRSNGNCSINADSLTDRRKVFAPLLAIEHSDQVADFANDRILPVSLRAKLTPGMAEVYEISVPQDYAVLESAHGTYASLPGQYARKVCNRDDQRTQPYLPPECDQSLAYSSQLERWMRLDYRLDHLLSHYDEDRFYGKQMRNILQCGRVLLSQHTFFLQFFQLENLQTIHDPRPSPPEGKSRILTTTRLERMTALVDTLDDLYTELRTICHATGKRRNAKDRTFIPIGAWRDVYLASQRLEEVTRKVETTIHSLCSLSLPISDNPVLQGIEKRFDMAMSETGVGHPSTSDRSSEAKLVGDDNSASTTSLALSCSQQADVGDVILGCWSCVPNSQLQLLLDISSYCIGICYWLFQRWLSENNWKGPFDWTDNFDEHYCIDRDNQCAM